MPARWLRRQCKWPLVAAENATAYSKMIHPTAKKFVFGVERVGFFPASNLYAQSSRRMQLEPANGEADELLNFAPRLANDRHPVHLSANPLAHTRPPYVARKQNFDRCRKRNREDRTEQTPNQ